MKGNHVQKEDEQQRRTYHANGDIDLVAAEKVHISTDSFRGWRNRRGLPSNGYSKLTGRA